MAAGGGAAVSSGHCPHCCGAIVAAPCPAPCASPESPAMSPSRRMAGTGDTGDRELELQTKVRGDFKITEKAPIRAFSWLKALELSYLRHYAKWAVNRHGIGTQTKKS